MAYPHSDLYVFNWSREDSHFWDTSKLQQCACGGTTRIDQNECDSRQQVWHSQTIHFPSVAKPPLKSVLSGWNKTSPKQWHLVVRDIFCFVLFKDFVALVVFSKCTLRGNWSTERARDRDGQGRWAFKGHRVGVEPGLAVYGAVTQPSENFSFKISLVLFNFKNVRYELS